MKQTVTVRDNISNKLRDAVSSDLRGYVEVDVKNAKTGEIIEHQENHNLIVYGGREWLLRRALGSSLGNNDFAQNTCIRWVGFGCGGGEAGNPLQSGATVGSDTDLRQPVRIRFDDDSNTSNQSNFYASRVLPNGSIVPGYFKRITDVTLKEDHANPYVSNGSTKYPSLIAELRIELSSDDCNGENYTENGNLIAYQDINELALFISDANDDPGKNGVYDECFFNLSRDDQKTYTKGSIYAEGIIWDEVNHYRKVPFAMNAGNYVFQIQVNKAWKTVSPGYKTLPITEANKVIVRENNRRLEFSFDGGSTFAVVPEWDYTYQDGESLKTNDIRFYGLGVYTISFDRQLPKSLEKDVYFELQYRNFYNEPWNILETGKFDKNDTTAKFGPKNFECKSLNYPDISETTYFRVRQTTIANQEIHITGMEIDDTSYDVKCFVSQDDIKRLEVGQFMYTPAGVNYEGNMIPQSNPAMINDIYNPKIVNPDTANQHTPYFVIERGGLYNKDWKTAPKVAKIYDASKEKPYTMFSRVSLSSIRKTIDREIVVIYKIYC